MTSYTDCSISCGVVQIYDLDTLEEFLQSHMEASDGTPYTAAIFSDYVAVPRSHSKGWQHRKSPGAQIARQLQRFGHTVTASPIVKNTNSGNKIRVWVCTFTPHYLNFLRKAEDRAYKKLKATTDDRWGGVDYEAVHEIMMGDILNYNKKVLAK